MNDYLRNLQYLAVTNNCSLFVCSVLVHSGGVHGGHYYAYIRPTLSNQWYDPV